MTEAPLAVLVLGPHRSGTSCVTELVHALGFELGRDLLGARPDNPRGLWENAAVVSVSESLLADAASAWYDPGFLELGELLDPEAIRAALAAVIEAQFGAPGASVVIKDPRLCRAARPCAAALRQMGYRVRFVLALRDPRASAESLYRRDGIPRAAGITLWLVHMLGALRALRGEPLLVVEYDRLLRDRAPLARLATWLRGDQPPAEEFLCELGARIVPELRHAGTVTAPSCAGPLENLAACVFARLRAMEDMRIGTATLVAWEAQFRAARAAAPRWLAGQPLVVMHGAVAMTTLPVALPDLGDAGLLLILDGEEGSGPVPHELLTLAAIGRIGLFWNLGVRGEAASLARGLMLASAGQDVLLLRTSARAAVGQIVRAAIGREPLELISAAGDSQALWLPAAGARGLDGWAHVALGDGAWASLAAAAGARLVALPSLKAPDGQ